jgi:dTDP-4-amino-4,6-dideoxygalactose transaminase
MNSSAQLAIDGGKPVRTRLWPRWPVYDRRERRALMGVLHSRHWGTLGPRVEDLQERFCKLTGTPHAIAVCNGTVSLELILRGLGIGRGDEVIVPPYTFVATASSVLTAGATPIFADIEPDSLALDPDRVAESLTDRTRAVIAVHIAGRPADMDQLETLARSRGLALIEDAAQAHGASWRGRPVGGLGRAASFSFQLSKNMSAGEGGMVTTCDQMLAERCWSIHHCGRSRGGAWYGHALLGTNYRMTDWQAAILIAQMSRLDEQSARREEGAKFLDQGLSGMDGVFVPRPDPRVTRHAHHLYVFRINASRLKVPLDRFAEALRAEGIPATTGYTPLHRQELFVSKEVRRVIHREVDYADLDMPVVEAACREILWLPQYLLLARRTDLQDVLDAVEKVGSHHIRAE